VSLRRRPDRAPSSDEFVEGTSPASAGTSPRKAAPSAYQRALGLLVRREHSAGELKRKLRDRGIEEDEAGDALEALQRQGFQDDRRYAEALIRSRALVGQGPVRIRAELRVNAVPAADIEAAFMAAEADGVDWAAIACRVAARFRPGLRAAEGADRHKARQRAVAFLPRRGFPQDLVRAALALEPTDEANFLSD